MPRPRRFRRVFFEPDVTYFKPAGIPKTELEQVTLSVDEFESVRLKDLEGMGQKQAAENMDISQPTFHRLVLAARKKIADAIVKGKAIRIEGGNFKMVQPKENGMGLGGRGGMNGPYAAGPGGNCVCPKCGHEQVHVRGQPCAATKCAKCGTGMVRK